MAHLFRLTRQFLFQKPCWKETVRHLSNGIGSCQAPPPSQVKPSTADPVAIRASDNVFPLQRSSSFTSYEEILSACGGADDAAYKRLTERSIAAYNADRENVDSRLLPVIRQNKLVLFVEGTVDNPKSLLSMNVIKMLTQLQSLPLVAIDVTAHPAILGFALTHGKKSRCPFLFVDGVCLGSHDSLMQLYQSGALAKQVAGHLTPTSPYFSAELPIALY